LAQGCRAGLCGSITIIAFSSKFLNLLNQDAKNKIQDIISGTYFGWKTDTCTAVRNFLCGSFSPIITVKEDFDNPHQKRADRNTERLPPPLLN